MIYFYGQVAYLERRGSYAKQGKSDTTKDK